MPVTGTWLDITPTAAAPLWQVEQLPGAMPVWLKVAPVNVVVDLWQVSQLAVVRTWVADLPIAVEPL